MGSLCGVGDLVLTCTGSLSRNWTVGNRLAKGEVRFKLSRSGVPGLLVEAGGP